MSKNALSPVFFSDILAIDPMSLTSNVNIAKIFSSVMLHAYKDKEFARTCLKRALLFNPNSSKANHRMGILHKQLVKICSIFLVCEVVRIFANFGCDFHTVFCVG